MHGKQDFTINTNNDSKNLCKGTIRCIIPRTGPFLAVLGWGGGGGGRGFWQSLKIPLTLGLEPPNLFEILGGHVNP